MCCGDGCAAGSAPTSRRADHRQRCRRIDRAAYETGRGSFSTASRTAGIEMGDDRRAHARVPELGDMLGDTGRRAAITLGLFNVASRF
jgi:hypothetical protein